MRRFFKSRRAVVEIADEEDAQHGYRQFAKESDGAAAFRGT